MDWKRLMKHLFMSDLALRRAFPKHTLRSIERAIKECEASHEGQIRFAVEAALPLPALLRGQTARERAVEVFSLLRVWDTEHNNGVLIYLLLADRNVEIVADRGIHRRAGKETWEDVCRRMEVAFMERRFEEGAVEGIRLIGEHLARHFPGQGPAANELPDRPVIL